MNLFNNCFLIYLKMFCQNNKERLQKISSKNFRNLSAEQKEKKWQYGRKRYKNFSEDGKQKLVEYREKCYKIWKNKNASQIKTDWDDF